MIFPASCGLVDNVVEVSKERRQRLIGTSEIRLRLRFILLRAALLIPSTSLSRREVERRRPATTMRDIRFVMNLRAQGQPRYGGDYCTTMLTGSIISKEHFC